MLKAVFFDVGNTLLKPHPSVPEVCRQVLAEAGHVRDVSAIDALMPLVDEYYEDRYREDDTFWTDEGETSQVWVGMYSLLCRRLGLGDQAEALARRVYDKFGDPSHWRLYPDVEPAFRRLTQAGMKVGIISNWDARLSGLLQGLGLSEYLETIVCSADVGLRKPDPRIFELACGRLGVRPSEAAHVGDHHYADIVGAQASGMLAVLIDRHDGTTPSRSGFIRTLEELEAVLTREMRE